MPNISPLSTSNDKSVTAAKLPKYLVTLLFCKIAIVFIALRIDNGGAD
jgi:hypothetical protein